MQTGNIVKLNPSVGIVPTTFIASRVRFQKYEEYPTDTELEYIFDISQ